MKRRGLLVDNNEKILKLSPYVPNTIPQNTLYVAPEGKWAPMDDNNGH